MNLQMAYLQLSATEMADSIVMLEENYTLSFNREITTIFGWDTTIWKSGI